MDNRNLLRNWFRQVRGPFLVLSAVLVWIGVAASARHGIHNWFHAGLLCVGVVLTHISVNLFNELSDFETGIDALTVRTPFSGGSGMLITGTIPPNQVRAVAYGSLGIAALIGVYFCLVSGWPILLLMIAGGLAVRFYTSHFSRWFLGEPVAGLALGSLVVQGVYFALTRELPAEIIIVSIPPGILTSLLLFLNEFPDIDADRKGGRRHLVVRFGTKKSARIYIFGLASAYALILAAPFVSSAPASTLIALATLPIGIKAGKNVLDSYEDRQKLIHALGMNVLVVILTDSLLAVGYTATDLFS